MQRQARNRKAFTLIELLVVIAIIALLIGILLPALGAARRSAWAAVAGVNARSIATALAIYTTDNKDYHPLAYWYPDTELGYEYDIAEQYSGNAENLRTGYAHWSYVLFDNGNVPQDAFESPGTTNGGAPRSNWGLNPIDSEAWQQSDTGDTGGTPSLLTDRQVPRLGFTVNGALIPRNKVNEIDRNGGIRENRFTKTSEPVFAGNTILAAEMRDTGEWKSVAGDDLNGGGDTPPEPGTIVNQKSHSHRPIVPFNSLLGGDEYNTPDFNIANFVPFKYQDRAWFQGNADTFQDRGAFHSGRARDANILLASTQHDGKGNYAFTDGHVERLTIEETIEDRKWGDRFWSISGNRNQVIGPRDDEGRLWDWD